MTDDIDKEFEKLANKRKQEILKKEKKEDVKKYFKK